MTDYFETKSQLITQKMVWEAYQEVKRNKGAGGVDGLSFNELEQELSKHLYKLWNRLTSGSYHPMAVRRVEIPKKSGGTRKLVIPTILDRVAQQVAKTHLERILEPIFHPSSYGYRPNRNCHQAVEQSCKNCFNHDFVIDIDITNFFDSIDHELLMGQGIRF